MEFFLPNGEKRAFPRTRLSLSCELVFDDGDRRVLGQCLDLSTTGARVVLSEEVTTGVKARFRLREHLGNEPFEARVEITRVELFNEDMATEEQTDSEPLQDKYCAGLKMVGML